MQHFQTAFGSIIQLAIGFYLIIASLRFVLELLRADFRNPLVQVIVRATNLPLSILRRITPEIFGIDFAAIVLIWLIATAKLLALLFGANAEFNFSGVAVLAFTDGLSQVLWVFLIAVLVRVILSWVAPHAQHPAARLAVEVSEPAMAPFRRILPAVGGLDLSPMLAMLAFHLVQRMLLTPLNNWGASLL